MREKAVPTLVLILVVATIAVSAILEFMVENKGSCELMARSCGGFTVLKSFSPSANNSDILPPPLFCRVVDLNTASAGTIVRGVIEADRGYRIRLGSAVVSGHFDSRLGSSASMHRSNTRFRDQRRVANVRLS